MYTNATLVARPTRPAPKNQIHGAMPLAPLVPGVFIMIEVVSASPPTERMVVTQ